MFGSNWQLQFLQCLVIYCKLKYSFLKFFKSCSLIYIILFKQTLGTSVTMQGISWLYMYQRKQQRETKMYFTNFSIDHNKLRAQRKRNFLFSLSWALFGALDIISILVEEILFCNKFLRATLQKVGKNLIVLQNKWT